MSECVEGREKRRIGDKDKEEDKETNVYRFSLQVRLRLGFRDLAVVKKERSCRR